MLLGGEPRADREVELDVLLTCPLQTRPRSEGESGGGRKRRRTIDGTREEVYCGADHWKLREAEVELSRGKKVPEMCRKIGVTEQTYYRWKKEYGGLRMDQAKRLKDLEKENARL